MVPLNGDKMVGVRMGSGELIVKNVSNGLKVPWSDSKLDSAHTEFIDNNLGGRWPDRGVTVVREEAYSSWVARSSIGVAHVLIDVDRTS